MPVSKINIAIADDSILMCEILTAILNKEEQFQVVLQAANAHELLSGLEQLTEPPEVCIVEANDTVLDRCKTLTVLRNRYPDMKLLGFTTYMVEYTVVNMIQHGINGFLLRCSSTNDLFAAINELQAKGYYYSDTVPKETYEIARKKTLPEFTEKEWQYLTSYKAGDKNYTEAQSKNFRDSTLRKLNTDSLFSFTWFMSQAGNKFV